MFLGPPRQFNPKHNTSTFFIDRINLIINFKTKSLWKLNLVKVL